MSLSASDDRITWICAGTRNNYRHRPACSRIIYIYLLFGPHLAWATEILASELVCTAPCSAQVTAHAYSLWMPRVFPIHTVGLQLLELMLVTLGAAEWGALQGLSHRLHTIPGSVTVSCCLLPFWLRLVWESLQHVHVSFREGLL